MVRRKKLVIRRNPVVVPPVKDLVVNDEDLMVNDEDETVVPDDDCAVVDDADDELEENRNDDDEANDSDAENDQPEDLPSEQEVSAILASRFGEDIINEAEQSDGDSADDIWNDDTIPDPLSEEDEDDEDIEDRVRREDEQDPDALLALGKCYNDTEDFKLALLRYSLKTGFDIKIFISNENKCGAERYSEIQRESKNKKSSIEEER
ncbi:hypothetical protein AALP_AA8G042300 [Arabis alpina]|uniref:Uncharacterized protein n=1 Tax=Arabis alpina TaxID=50452 RepID=A0A087G4W9_ARAAL|nr:hypothetical protein AALP_AA8G042300 [Arabis alpina]